MSKKNQSRRESRVYSRMYAQSFEKYIRSKMKVPLLVRIIGKFLPWIRKDWEDKWMIKNQRKIEQMARISADSYYQEIMGANS